MTIPGTFLLFFLLIGFAIGQEPNQPPPAGGQQPAQPQQPGAANPPAANPGAANPPANQPPPEDTTDTCAGNGGAANAITIFESPRTGGAYPFFTYVDANLNITWRFELAFNPKYPRRKVSLYYALAEKESVKTAWKLIDEIGPNERTYIWKVAAMADGNYKIRINFDGIDPLLNGAVDCWFDGFPYPGMTGSFKVINPSELESYGDEFKPNSSQKMIGSLGFAALLMLLFI